MTKTGPALYPGVCTPGGGSGGLVGTGAQSFYYIPSHNIPKTKGFMQNVRPPTAHPNDEECTNCKSPEVIAIIEGGIRCYFCDNQINLCQECLDKVRKELAKF